MKLPRRRFLHLAAGAAVLPAASSIARAQTYPTRPVRTIVGVPAGGPLDISARLISQFLIQSLNPCERDASGVYRIDRFVGISEPKRPIKILRHGAHLSHFRTDD